LISCWIFRRLQPCVWRARAETAINIGYSCRLLKEEMEEVYIVDGETESDVRRQLQEAVDDMDDKGRGDGDEDGMMPGSTAAQRQQQWQADGLWRRNRVDAAPTVGADLSGFALVISGSSLVSFSPAA